MLIKCPECNHDVSDTAVNCPNCGYGVQESIEEIRVNAKAQEEKAAAEKAEKEQREIENRKRFSKWIKRGILVAVAVFVIVLIGERIYLSKYNNYKETMRFIKALELSIKNDSSSIQKEYPDIKISDIKEIRHISYEEELDDGIFITRDFYFVITNDYVYNYLYSESSHKYIMVILQDEFDEDSPYYHTAITSNDAFSEYWHDKSDNYNYDEIIDLNDYKLLLSKIILLLDNTESVK